MTKTIQVNEELYKQIVAHCEAAGVTIESFVEQCVTNGLPQVGTPVYQQQDDEEIKERLKSLGYID